MFCKGWSKQGKRNLAPSAVFLNVEQSYSLYHRLFSPLTFKEYGRARIEWCNLKYVSAFS